MILLLNISCSKDNNDIPETFVNADRPYFKYNAKKNQYVLEPWNYSLLQNKNRNYPLIIFLHGSGGAGNINYLNYIGYDSPHNKDDKAH